MTWYPRIQAAIKTSLAFLAPTQATNLALLVSALLRRQTLCLSELARAYARPPMRRVPVLNTACSIGSSARGASSTMSGSIRSWSR